MKNRIEIHKQLYYIFLILVVVSLPFSYAINSISMILLVVNWIAEGKLENKLKKVVKSPLIILFIAFYLWHLVGMIYTSNITEGLVNLQKKLPLLVFPLVIGTSERIEIKEFQKIMFYFIFSCLTASVICLLYASYRSYLAGQFYFFDPVSHHKDDFFFYQTLSGILIHAVYFATYLALCSFFIFELAYSQWHSLSNRKKCLIVLLLSYFLIFIFLLTARITIISITVIAFIITLRYFYKVKKVFQGIGLVLFILALMISIIFFVPSIKQRFSDIVNSDFKFENNPDTNSQLAGKMDGVEMRLAKWQFTIMAGKDDWFLGKGTGDGMDALLETYLKNNFYEGYGPQLNSHNQFLQTWLALGAIGIFSFLLSLIVPAIIAFKQKKYLYILFLVLISFFCFTESILDRQHGVVFYAFFNSLFAFHALNTSVKEV